jgi:hypothetical protein
MHQSLGIGPDRDFPKFESKFACARAKIFENLPAQRARRVRENIRV